VFTRGRSADVAHRLLYHRIAMQTILDLDLAHVTGGFTRPNHPRPNLEPGHFGSGFRDHGRYNYYQYIMRLGPFSGRR